MKKYRTLLLILLFSSFYSGLLADEWKNVCVKMNNGTEITFDLSSSPRFWFMSEWMYVSIGKFSTEFTSSDVEKVYYKDRTVSSTKPVKGSSTLPNVFVKNDQVIIRGLTERSTIKLFSLDGKQLSKPMVTTQTEATINVGALPSGVFLLQINNTTAKFVKQ
jgi:hypothetical protein